MAWRRYGSRTATDYGFTGAVIGFVISVIQFAVLLVLSLRSEGKEGSGGCVGCACLLRLLALLGLTLGTGLGYLIGRWLSG
jgi:hypothetical protein